MTLRKALAVALLFSGAAQAAEAPAKAPIDACALMTDAEVAAVIGAKVLPGKRMDEGFVAGGQYSGTCVWRMVTAGAAPNDPDKPMGGATFAILNAMQWPAGSGKSKEFLESFFDAAKNGVIDQTPVQLKIATAEDAIWWGDGVAVRKGDRSFGVSVFIPGKPRAERRVLEESLARKIAPRL